MGEKYSKALPVPEKIYVVDFFCGCGGVSWGFKHTRQSHLAFEVLAGIDINKHSLASYSANVGAKAIMQDIFELAERPELLKELLPELEEVANDKLLFVGCAPCQGFSAHRKKDPRDDNRNNLMLAFAKLCKFYRPEYVVMENVPEILAGRFDHYYTASKQELEECGYKVNDAVLDLSKYGVPQRRKRALVLASQSTIISMPEPVFADDQVNTVRNAIGHLEPLEAGAQDPNDPMHRSPNHVERILEKIKKIPADGGDRRALSEEHQLECHSKIDGKPSSGFTDVYGRLRWDMPSVTITAKSSTPSCGRFLHPEQHRNISVREAAILQSFPQSYDFKGPFVQRYRQIGEAVPPLFSRSVARKILDTVNRKRPLIWPMVSQSSEDETTITDAPIAVVDAFCGAGGIALGFEYAGFQTAYAFDVEPEAIATFRKNLSKKAEVNDVRSDEVRAKIKENVGSRPYVLVGGPPCQGFSQQRRGDDNDPRNNLVLAFSDLVGELKDNPPIAVVLENVTYLDSPRGRHILEEFVASMGSHGYEIQRFDLNSADFGVPQLRKRIVLVCTLKKLGPTKVAEIEPLTSDVWPTVGDALKGLSDCTRELANHEPSKEGSLNRRRIAFVDMGEGRLSIPDELQLECHRKYGGHLDVYGRLDWFSQARTITGGFDSFTRGEFGHPFLHRSITHREAARIQGFPDYYEFAGNRAAVRKQIGNAVPPPLAYALATEIKKWYEAVDCSIEELDEVLTA